MSLAHACGAAIVCGPVGHRRLAPIVVCGLLAGCSVNAATGRLQLTTVSESDEIKLGRETDAEIVEALGLYEHPQLTPLVERVGAEVSAHSERPTLPWTFRVLDEPGVNAFALPGGFIYATRGLLVHLSSEDELSAVLGHEVGHVTARHGVVQLRKSRVAAASVGLFRVVDPNLRHVGGIAASTAGLALLKHSRDDEYEADSLGLRYSGRAGYDRAATVAVFEVLATVSRIEQSERLPTWLSTHPDPELRRDRVRQMLPGSGEPPAADPEYLAMLDGVLYGTDPRDGFLAGRTLVHPKRGFRFDFPEQWTVMHEGARAIARSDDDKALLIMVPAEAESAADALEKFFADGEIKRGENFSGKVGGFTVESAGFSMATSTGALYGLLAFIDYGDTVIELAAIGPDEGWDVRSQIIAESFASFRRAEAALLSVQPMRISLHELPEAMTLTEANTRWPSVIDMPHLAALNGVEPEESLPAGMVLKRVVGFNPSSIEPSTRPGADSSG